MLPLRHIPLNHHPTLHINPLIILHAVAQLIPKQQSESLLRALPRADEYLHHARRVD